MKATRKKKRGKPKAAAPEAPLAELLDRLAQELDDAAQTAMDGSVWAVAEDGAAARKGELREKVLSLLAGVEVLNDDLERLVRPLQPVRINPENFRFATDLDEE